MKKTNLNFLGFVIGLTLLLVNARATAGILYVCIDPGHGGSKAGAIGRVYGIKEKNANLWVALSLRDSLLHSGYPDSVVIPMMTRENDTTVSFDDRVAIAMGDNPYSTRATQFISIHHNSVSDTTDTTTNGTETWWCSLWWTPAPDYLEREYDSTLAAKLQSKMAEMLKYDDRWLKETEEEENHIYVLRYTTMISALCEISFISCKTIDSLFHYDSTEYAKKEASAIYQGWYKYINEDPIIVIRTDWDGGWINVDGYKNYWGCFHGCWNWGEMHTIEVYDYSDFIFCFWENWDQSHTREIYVGILDEVYTAYYQWTEYRVFVQEPFSGDVFTAGDIEDICWFVYPGADSTSSLDIFLSTDGGNSYPDTIALSHYPLSYPENSMPWVIPNRNSDRCKIKIVAHDDFCNTSWDVSYGYFTINCVGTTPPRISPPPIQAATGGSSFSGGTTRITNRALISIGTELIPTQLDQMMTSMPHLPRPVLIRIAPTPTW